MSASDTIHDAVKNALVKDGWTITHEPYTIAYEDVKVYADLAAERILQPQGRDLRIVVEIKSFLGRSPVHDFDVALGQYVLYRTYLNAIAPDHSLYLAISDEICGPV
jgi:hypothetical protein